MKTTVGCLVAVLAAPFMVLALIAAGLGSWDIGGATEADFDWDAGPIYQAGSFNLEPGKSLSAATIHDLGFGPSDAARVDRMIAAINPDSPLVGQGQHILALGQRWRVDPLLIAQWQHESGMATNGINSPANGANMTWDAAQEATQLYGCTRGPSSLGHVWARCPTIPAGLSLWKDYVGTYYPGRGIERFDRYVNAYNPCSDSARYGFICGTEYGVAIISLIRQSAGPPATAGTAEYVVPKDCPPARPVQATVGGVPWARSEQGRKIEPSTVPVLDTILGRNDYTSYQGWGPTDFPGEPPYTYQGVRYPLFHTGYDLNFPGDDGAPLYAPDDATATKVVFPDGNLVEVLELPSGYKWQLLHLSRQVAEGAVRKGQLVGHIGSTGNSSGPHLHLELKPPGQVRAWVPVEQWVCRNMPSR